MCDVIKRNGSHDKFDIQKVIEAMRKAFIAEEKVVIPDVLDLLALRVTADFQPKVHNNMISVEDIQDSVEKVLSDAGFSDVAKSYILYRKQREAIRNLKSTFLDYKELVNSYVNTSDWRVKENSTITYSVGGLILSNSGAITANYWLSEIYDKEIGDAHRNADLHIHDLSMLAPYCAGWSLKQLIQEGLGGIPGKITSAPAKHLSSLCNQMVNFIGIMQNEWAGAQAFSSFDTYLAPFVRIDNLSYQEVKNCIQSFVFGVNTPSRWGSQAPFTNITLDWKIPNDLKDLPAIIGGKPMDFTYGDCQKEADMVNKAFIEVMIEGDANGRGLQYPIPTYSITKDFDWSETENNKLLFEMAAKYGTPYFSNYVNSDMEPTDVRSMAILGTQNLIYKDKFGRISKNEVRHLVHQWQQNPETEYSVLMNGKFVNIIDMFEIPYEKYKDYVTIKTNTGIEQHFSFDHKCVVVRDGKITNVLAQDVLQSDKLLLARHGYDESEIGSYQAGKIVGYYLAEGWVAHNGVEVNFAINEKRTDICEEIEEFFKVGFACKVTIIHDKEGHIFKVKVFGKAAAEYVKRFIDGGKAIQKHITAYTYDTSLDFRRGIYDGYLETDGCKSSNIFAHTTNKKLCMDMITLFATIGKYFKFRVKNSNTRYFKPDKSDYERFTSYVLTIYNPEVFNDDYYMVGVDEVTLNDAHRVNTVYNFTVDTDEHLYELPNGIITHQCCRLRLDLRELRKKSGGFFGSGESTGSIGVVTLNLPRLAYLAEDEADFYKRLDKLMDIAARSLDIKRKVLTKYLELGMYPYAKRYLGTFNNHFSTIGLVGMNEAGLNAKWLRKDLTHPETQQFARDVLNHMRERLSDYQEKYGDLFNLEATPAESTAYRLAKHDKERWSDIITASDGTPYYTNSSNLPVGYTEDVFEALDIQDSLQTLYTSGTVFHVFLGERLNGWKSAAQLVRKIAENYHIPYYTLSPTYSVCPDHGYIVGEVSKCPQCGKETEVYSRITGYYRPLRNWNDGKVQEFKERKEYDPDSKKKTAEENLLFSTATCPNCNMAENILKQRGIQYKKIVVKDEATAELAKKYDIQSVPVLVSDGRKYNGVNEIRTFAV